MRQPSRLASVAALSLLTVLLSGCRGCVERPTAGPEAAPEVAAALALFGFAGQKEITREDLGPLIQEDLLATATPALLDSLEQMSGPTDLEVIQVQPMLGLERTAVDVLARLPGGGSAVYSIQTAKQADDTWRVVWFRGPGVFWPPQARERGAGLSTWPTLEGRESF